MSEAKDKTPQAAVPAIDLSSIDTVKAANEGVDVELYHPGTNVNLGITIRMLGRDSDEFRRLSAEQNRRRINKMSKGGSFKVNVLSPEEMESDLITILAACTISWNNVRVDQKLVECNRGNAAMLYTRFPWIREQVDSAVGDRALFTKG